MYLDDFVKNISCEFDVLDGADEHESPLYTWDGFGNFNIPDEYKDCEVVDFYSTLIEPTGCYSSDDYNSKITIIIDTEKKREQTEYTEVFSTNMRCVDLEEASESTRLAYDIIDSAKKCNNPYFMTDVDVLIKAFVKEKNKHE